MRGLNCLRRLEFHPADERGLVVGQAKPGAADPLADKVAVIVDIGVIDAGMEVDEGPQSPARIERWKEVVLAAEGEVSAVIGGIEGLTVIEQIADAAGLAIDPEILV